MEGCAVDDNETQHCGCPLEYHLADCDGTKARTKEDYLEYYSQFDSMDDVPDDELDW